METIIVALIGAFSTIITALLSKKISTSKEDSVDRLRNIGSPIMSILNLGVSLTTLAVVITILIFPLNRVEKQIASTKKAMPLDKFLASPLIPEIERLKKSDTDANAILDGAGPKELTVNDRVWKTGDISYVPSWERVYIVFPSENRKDLTHSAKCGIQPGGKITVVGFSLDRKSVLFQYKAPGGSAGTPCDTGTYFFYPYSKA